MQLTELDLDEGNGAAEVTVRSAAAMWRSFAVRVTPAPLRALNPLETRRLGAAEVERGQGGQETFRGEESRRRSVLPAARRNHDSGDAGF